ISWRVWDRSAPLIERGAECGNSRAPSTGFRRRVAERRHKTGAGQDRAHDFALHSDAAAVNDADGAEAHLVRLLQVGLDHTLDVARRHAVQVEDIGDGNADRFAGLRKIVRHAISLYRRSAVAAKYTYKQGQYLLHLYIHQAPQAGAGGIGHSAVLSGDSSDRK